MQCRWNKWVLPFQAFHYILKVWVWLTPICLGTCTLVWLALDIRLWSKSQTVPARLNHLVEGCTLIKFGGGVDLDIMWLHNVRSWLYNVRSWLHAATSFDDFVQEYWQGGHDTVGPSMLRRFHWNIFLEHVGWNRKPIHLLVARYTFQKFPHFEPAYSKTRKSVDWVLCR